MGWWKAPDVEDPVVVLVSGDEERRVPDVADAYKDGEKLVVINEYGRVMAEFALRDVRSWCLEDNVQSA